MTTYQGIAAVTQTLSYVVGNAARAAVPEAGLTIAPPEQPAAGARDAPRLNVYLVQVSPDPTRRNADLPMRDATGQLVSVPSVALNLRYMLSFFGATTRAHLMLGAVEVALHEQPLLDAATIALALTGHPELKDSGLELQTPPVRVVPAPTTLEELSRFWSGFFQMPYTLSTLLDASGVVLQSSATPAATLPVTSVAPSGAPGLTPAPPAAPAARPVVEAVTVDATGALAAQLSAPVLPAQSVVLGLSARKVDHRAKRHSAELTALPRTKATTAVRFAAPAPPLAAGTYVATVTVDGVGSIPGQDATGRFDAPQVELA